jgi:hypothetical protein
MAYARLFVVRAYHGREQDVVDETQRLINHLSHEPGFMASWELRSVSNPAVIVRATLWQTREQADHAANTETAMAMMSHIMNMSEETSVESGVFNATVTLPNEVHPAGG